MIYKKAVVARKKGKYQYAVELFQRVITQEPQNAAAYGGLSLTWIYLGNYAQALALANQAIQLDKHCDDAHLSLAVLAHLDGQKEKFMDEIDQAFIQKPFVYDVVYEYACLLAEKKEILPAIPTLEKIMAADENKECRNYLQALVVLQTGQYRMAVKHAIPAIWRRKTPRMAAFLLKTLLIAFPVYTILALLAFLASTVHAILMTSAMPAYSVALVGIYVLLWLLMSVWVLILIGLIHKSRKMMEALTIASVLDVSALVGLLLYWFL
jgi:tetratricopeptide (TPR) repeat protein